MVGLGRLASLLRIMLTPSSATHVYSLYTITFLPGDCDDWVGQAGQVSQQDVDPQLSQVFTVYTITFLPGDCDGWVGQAGQVSQ